MDSSRWTYVVVGLLVVNICLAKTVKIDAAFQFVNEYIILSAGDDVLVMDKEERSQAFPPIKAAHLGLPELGEIGAAFTSDDFIYFFGADTMVVFNPYTGEVVNTLDYQSDPNLSILSQFTNGPDAAAKRGDRVYFFEGCEVVSTDLGMTDWDSPSDVGTLNLPCHPDAAWGVQDATVLLQGDQVWFWSPYGRVSGPFPFDKFFEITSWKLAPYEEE